MKDETQYYETKRHFEFSSDGEDPAGKKELAEHRSNSVFDKDIPLRRQTTDSPVG